ncbi:MAG: TldD/PmbA family protein [Methanosphaera sp.]|uniref:TldD/PmbA family protein n=1 Tax=Methanosphaera sp. TaxID=2666342 RepID=UPI0025F1EF56|nr:TldD/PmbA family protein [Methanosphaera sp.]MCI5867393.1 TldD/PmbA family protein [Methanosphaera sp.]MDD6534539.1 TldD/PmbA family protein [Methanosphaera sp.]MDY3955792.1 TldD/PmbA family protein [Methanosphaera sp.]
MDHLLDNILNKLTKQVDHAEVYAEKIISTDVDILNDKINHAKDEDIYGIGIRIFKDQKQGFAYTTNIDRIDETINQAINNSKLNHKDENLVMIDNSKKYSQIKGLYNKDVIDMDVEDAIEYSQTLIDLTKDAKCNPTSGGFSTTVSEIQIMNSNGIDVKEQQTGCGASISVNVDDNDVVSSAYYYDLSHSVNIDLENIVQKATKLALDSRNAKPTQTRDSNVILNHTAAVSLLGTFLSAIGSENVQRGRSLFKDKLEMQVANENFTLTDDGTLDYALNSSIADGEGMPSEKTTLIEDGILKSFIYDAYHAKKDEADVQTTANAVRDSYSSTPSVGFTNLKLDFKDVVKVSDIQDGIIVDNVMGAHTANPITGDFSVEVLNAFEIRNGEIANPIKKGMISGNIFEIMKDAKAVDSEIRQVGSCITPQILADNLRIIG